MRIAIFNCWIDYQTIPMLTSFIASLAKRKVVVDLFTIGNPEPRSDLYITIINYPRFFFNTLSPYVILVRSLRQLRRGGYDSLFAVDAHMILATLISAKIFRCKAKYISLEIYVKQDINNIYHRFYYCQQRFLLRYFDEILIMDEERKDLLLRNSKIYQHKTRFALLPNAPLGAPKKLRTTFLHDRLGIANYKKLLLCPGEIASINSSFELSKLSKVLPADYVIVLHSRRKKNPKTLVLEFPENANFHLSLEPVESSELELLYSSAHIGLVIYTVASTGIGGENVRCIGKSSGKLAHFLQAGIPVIMSSQSYFQRISGKYRCGVCITDLNELPFAIKNIEDSYEAYVKGCLDCFQREMNFANAFDEYFSPIK